MHKYIHTTASIVALLYLAKKLYDSLHPSTHPSAPPPSRGLPSLIGNTPLVEIKSLSQFTGCQIYAKLELNNPGGSAKDRVALAIIQGNEKEGNLKPYCGDAIFEGTSGSTGISLAMLANAMGYKAHICLPDDTSKEKLQLLQAYGAIIHPVRPASIVDPNQYTNVARGKCQEAIAKGQRAIFADQFENEYNWKVHYATTGPEIWAQTQGNIDYFISGSGTGGTIAGVSRYLKEHSDSVKVVLADPQGSGLANRVNYGVMFDNVEREGTRRRHQVDTLVEGIGLNRLTNNFKHAEKYIDSAVRVSDRQALMMAKYLAENDGFFWGSSAAINCVAALRVAMEERGKEIVVVACDSGARHLSKFWGEVGGVGQVFLEDILNSS